MNWPICAAVSIFGALVSVSEASRFGGLYGIFQVSREDANTLGVPYAPGFR